MNPAGVRLELPLGPSVNKSDSFNQHAKRAARKEIHAYSMSVLWKCREQLGIGYKPFTGPVRYTAVFHYQNKRRIDLDNRVKPLQDALSFAKVWVDDKQVDDFRIVRGAPIKGSLVRLYIEPCIWER